MRWKSVFVWVGCLVSVFFVLGAIRFFGTMEPVIVKIEPALPGLEVVNREKLAVAQVEWWQPLTVKVNENGSVAMTFAPGGLDEYERREAEADEALRMAAPDDAFYYLRKWQRHHFRVRTSASRTS